MCLAGCGNEQQSNPDPPGETSPLPPTSLSAVSQAAYQILENILPQNVLDNISRPSGEPGKDEDVPTTLDSEKQLPQEKSHGDSVAQNRQINLNTEVSAGQGRYVYLISVSRKLGLVDRALGEEDRPSEGNCTQSTTDNTHTRNDVAKVIDVLRDEMKHHRISPEEACIVSEATKTGGAERSYLIQEQDITQVIDGAIAALSGSQRPLDGGSAKKSLKENHRMSLPRPDSAKIQPMPAATAEPATSISVPKTSYAMVPSWSRCSLWKPFESFSCLGRWRSSKAKALQSQPLWRESILQTSRMCSSSSRCGTPTCLGC